MSIFRYDEEGVSPVVGVILVVAVTVVLSVSIGSFVLSQQPAEVGDTQSSVRMEDQGDGVHVTAITVESPLTVRYNGVPVGSFAESDVGKELVIPSAPGESVSVVATHDGKDTVLTTHKAAENPALLSYYPLDGTAADASGHGRDAEPVRETVRSGIVQKSFNFTGGKNDTQTELRLPRDQFNEFRTVCFFVNPEVIKSSGLNDDGTAWDDHNIFHDNGGNDANNEYGWHLYNSTTVSVGYGREGRTDGLLTHSGISEDSWTFFCHTTGDSQMRLYVNGTEVNSTATPAGALNYAETGGRPLFGRHVPDKDTADGLYGRLDEVRFYDEQLSPEQVEMLYKMAVEAK